MIRTCGQLLGMTWVVSWGGNVLAQISQGVPIENLTVSVVVYVSSLIFVGGICWQLGMVWRAGIDVRSLKERIEKIERSKRDSIDEV